MVRRRVRVAATPRPPVDKSRRRRGHNVNRPWTRSWRRRGHNVDSPWTSRGDAAAATWTFRGDESRRRRGRDVESPWREVAANAAAATCRGDDAAAAPRRGSTRETRTRAPQVLAPRAPAARRVRRRRRDRDDPRGRRAGGGVPRRLRGLRAPGRRRRRGFRGCGRGRRDAAAARGPRAEPNLRDAYILASRQRGPTAIDPTSEHPRGTPRRGCDSPRWNSGDVRIRTDRSRVVDHHSRARRGARGG